jgi:hypothetical protein
MKGKRLVIMLSMLAFVVVLVVINSTLFTLQSISINWMTTQNKLQGVKDYQISENVSLGQNIFLLKKDNITNTLEKKYPFLRVVSIETKFPNKIAIHCAERESLYAVKLADDSQGQLGNVKYAIIDELGKILDIGDERYFEGASGELGVTPIKVNFESMALNMSNFAIGETIQDQYMIGLIKQLSYSIRESRYNPTTSKGVLKYINVVRLGEETEVRFETRSGIKLTIKDVENYTTDKLLVALERYNHYHYEGVVDCTIEVWYSNTMNAVIAKLL